MADSQQGIEQQVEKIILASFARERGDEQETTTQDETGERKVIDVDLYRLEGGAVLLVPGNTLNPLDTNAVESVPPPAQEQATPVAEVPAPSHVEDEQLEPVPVGTKRRGKRSYLLAPLLLLCILAAGAASYLYLLPLTATATVTITPKARSLHVTTTFPIASKPEAGQVQGRPLGAISFTKSKTVPATGHAYDNATRATGVITFYNADSQGYTIAVGTTFTVQGVTVVTDNPVTVQAAIPPSFGIGITQAHVVQVGSTGNIAAHAIDTRCCGSQFITATNSSAFSGGQDARSYSFIQSSDIQNAANDLLASLTPQATAALNKQAHTGEQLVSPLCSPKTQESAEPGSEAASVTVSVSQTCTSVAYTLSSLQQAATSTLAHMASPAYQEVGTAQATVNASTYANRSAVLKVSLAGIWVYHFTQAQLAQFTNHIAGES